MKKTVIWIIVGSLVAAAIIAGVLVFVLPKTPNCEKDGHTFGEWCVVTAPTCTEIGVEKRDCVNCDYYEEQDLAVTGHTYGEWHTIAAPTCSAMGIEKRDCASCDAIQEQSIAAIGHAYTSTVTAPTCTEKGYTTHSCYCGDTYVDAYVDALGHSYSDWYTTLEPSCMATGLDRRDCSDCGHYEEQGIAATGHSYEAVVIAPNCTEKGYTLYSCHCGDSYQDTYVAASGHIYGDWYIITEATCDAVGAERHNCLNCDYFEERGIPAIGHIYTDTVTPPTCTAKGYTTHSCPCGCSYVDAYVDALGHTYGDWYTLFEPDCIEKGVQRRECSVCHDYEEQGIAAYGHTYTYVVTPPTCTERGYTTYTCDCGDTYIDRLQNANGHSYGDWITVIEPTCEERGKSERECEACHSKQEQDLESRGHQYELVLTEDDESVYQCEFCFDQPEMADGDSILQGWEDQHVVASCDELFCFRVVSEEGEAYIYEHLSIMDASYLESLDTIAAYSGARASGAVSFNVVPDGDAANVWLITAVGGYASYKTYAAHITGELKFADYNTDTLVFSVEGPDRENIQFNQDNILFLKELETNSPGYYPYAMIYDENAERYYLTLGKGDAFDENCIGRVLCVGDYASTEEILSDSSRELYFGKIESIMKDAGGRTFIELSPPALGDLYSSIEYSGSGIADWSSLENSEELEQEIRTAFMNSESFVRMVSAANLAATAYAADYGYDPYVMSPQSLLDSLQIVVSVEKKEEEEKKGAAASIVATMGMDLKQDGKVIGQILVFCKAELEIELEVTVDLTTVVDGKEIVDFDNFSLVITNTNTATFDFSCEIKMNYSAETPDFIVNVKSSKIHSLDCRYYTQAKSKKNFTGYSLEEILPSYGVKTVDGLQDFECELCKPISKLCRTSFAVNANTKVVHCMNCVHVGKDLNNLIYVNVLPNASEYNYCKDCKPQNRTLEDFESYLVGSLQSEDWAATLETVKSYMKSASDPSDDVREELFTVPFTFTIITVDVSVDFVLDFDLEATLDYHNEKTWVNQIYIKRVGNKYICGNDPQNSGSTSNQSLDMMGRMELRIGGAISARVGFTGVSKFCYIGLTVEAGLYADVRGVLHASTVNGQSDTFYYAAYFEAGLYTEADFDVKIFWWDKNVSLLEKKIPLLVCGYDRAYYQFSEYDREIEITDAKTSIDSLDLLKVEYLYLPDLVKKSEELSATGRSGRYTVAYRFVNPDGSENKHISVQNGNIVLKDTATGTFEVTMVITVSSAKDAVSSFAGFTALTGDKGNMSSIFFLEPYTVTLSVSRQDEGSKGLEYSSNGDGTCSVVGIGSCTDTEIVIPKTSPSGDIVISIGEWAFFDCDNLTSIKIPDSVTSIGYGAFMFCTGLTSITVDDDNVKYHSAGNCLIETSTNTLVSGCKTSIIPDSVTSIGYGAFAYCDGLTNITIPDSVTSIGEGAFYGCTGLTSITIPDSVTSIGDQAFFGCTGLKSITIPDSVTSIGYGAFDHCESLISITIPDSVKSIGARAFRGCTGLKSITIPDSVKSIGEEAFAYCIGLKSITIPDSVKSIGEEAFESCIGLTSITIPDSVTSIGFGTFLSCTGLKSITIPDSVKSIGDRAFDSCESLTSITIPDSVTSIGACAFDSCTVLKSITIPDSVTSIGWGIFRHCTGLTSITISDSVTSIGEYAFSGCTGLKSITIPDSVKSIGYLVFEGCTGLTSITIPDSVTSIGACAFDSCTGLKSITIPDSVKSIGEYTFSGCTGLKSITIPDSVTSIGDWAFYRCESLTSITIPDSVKSIGARAFYGCIGLKSITLPFIGDTKDGNEDFAYIFGEFYADVPASLITVVITGGSSIGDAAFLGCAGLTSITIPNSVKSIGDGAFYGCTGLKSITIPDSVTSIGDYAFYGCTGLKSITISDSVASIGESAFYGCDSLTSITIPDSVKSIGAYAFAGCTGLTSITIPDSVTSIGDWAFFYCESLTSITIPDSVKSIGDGAFYGCTGLTSITIPDSVISIGEDAFAYCDSLTSVTIPDSVKSIGDGAFYGCESLTEVYFTGTEEEWEKINIGEYNENLLNAIGNYSLGLAYELNKKGTGYIVTGIGACTDTDIVIPTVYKGLPVVMIGEKAFLSCTSMTSIVIPDSVTSIGKYAFFACESLTSIVIGKGVTSIEASTFWDCFSLESITIPVSVVKIGQDAFSSCGSLKTINYAGSKAQWNSIVKETFWDYGTGSYTVCCTDGKIAK